MGIIRVVSIIAITAVRLRAGLQFGTDRGRAQKS
jgi:hypothetical protein